MMHSDVKIKNGIFKMRYVNAHDKNPEVIPIKKTGHYLVGINVNYMKGDERVKNIIEKSKNYEWVPEDDSLWEEIKGYVENDNVVRKYNMAKIVEYTRCDFDNVVVISKQGA